MESTALKFIADMESCDQPDKIAEILLNAYDSLGFSSIAAVKLPGPHEQLSETFLINTRDDNFMDGYYDKDYEAVDPVFEQFDPRTQAYTWSQAYTKSDISSRSELLNFANEFKMFEGIVVPIAQLGGHGLISAATDRTIIPKEVYAAAYLIGLCGCSKLFGAAASKLDFDELHPREYECLQWVAVGKTDPEIAEIMDLSKNTIRMYVERAKVKLGAPNRTAAAVIALRAGILNL